MRASANRAAAGGAPELPPAPIVTLAAGREAGNVGADLIVVAAPTAGAKCSRALWAVPADG
jgi:hypothetical protein